MKNRACLDTAEEGDRLGLWGCGGVSLNFKIFYKNNNYKFNFCKSLL